MRIGIVYPGGPCDPGAWSGIPSGLMHGLREAGAESVALDPSPPRPAEALLRVALAPAYPTDMPRHPGRSLLLAPMGPELAKVRSRTLARRVAAAAPLDAVVIINALCLPPPGVRLLTYEDMTVPLALRLGYPLWKALPRRAVRGRMRIQGELYRRAEACCLVTRFAADSVESDYGIPADRVRVVGLGRNHDPTLADRDWATPRFLFVGLEWERKRGDAVVAAFARVRERFPDAELDLVGRHPAVDAPGVRGHGPLTGAALADRFARATCFVMPSRMEPAGIVYAEAGAAGLASIGTSIGGAPEMIGDGGRTVDPGDQTGLEEAMLDLCDPDVARRLGDAARRHSARFTWRATAERMLAALR